MSVDQFSSQLLDEAKRFLEKFQDSDERPTAFLHASILLGMSSLEGHVNSICEDFMVREDLSPWEKSILSEKDVEFKDGDFSLGSRLKMHRLEDRLLFLCRRFSVTPLDRSSATWSRFREAVELRNRLVHPKDSMSIKEDQVRAVLEAILDVLDTLFLALYKQPYPASKRGLQSTLSF